MSVVGMVERFKTCSDERWMPNDVKSVRVIGICLHLIVMQKRVQELLKHLVN